MPECTGAQAQSVLIRLTYELERETGVGFGCHATDVADIEASGEALLEALASRAKDATS